MPIVYHIPLLTILITILSGILMLLIKNVKLCKEISLITIGVSFVLTILLFLALLNSETPFFNYALGYYPAPWGNELKVTLIESLMAVIFLLVIVAAQISGLELHRRKIEPDKLRYYYMMLNIMTASLLALVYTNDIFTVYVFLEINTIAASALMAIKLDGESLRATIKYYIMSAIGSAMFLLGIANLYGLTGHLAMEPLHQAILGLVDNNTHLTGLTITAVLLVVGIAVKSGLFPFHGWSPDSYSTATPASSAILSGVVSQAYILIGIKIIYRVFGLEVLSDLGIISIFLILGLLAMVMGSFFALFQKNINRTIAYSSVSQIGYIYTAIGLATPVGMAAAMFHMIHHSLSKAAIFLSIGAASEKAGTSNIRRLNGLGVLMPLTMILFALSAFSMIGIPPTIGFNAKWYLAEAFLQSNYRILVFILSLSTLMSAGYWLPIMVRSFFSKKAEDYKREKLHSELELSPTTTGPIIVLVALIFILVLFSRPIFNLFLNNLAYF